MKSIRKGLAAIITIVFVICSFVPHVVLAADDKIEFVLTDVTGESVNTLSGEAKIKVSVKGAASDVSIAQVKLNFEGNVKYKSIEFLKGENSPENGMALIAPNATLANSKKEINASIISIIQPLEFEREQDLFILTFKGEPGEKVKLSLVTDGTYLTIDGADAVPESSEEVTAVTSSENNVGKDITVKLVLDKIDYFPTAVESSIELRIISETEVPHMIYTVLNNVSVDNGGHRDTNTSVPTFVFSETVLEGITYTVSVSGIGYKTHSISGVDFSEPIEITNAEFEPGDVNEDGVVDENDKRLFYKRLNDDVDDADDPEDDFYMVYAISYDFDRDGELTEFDYAVYNEIELPEIPEDDDEKPGVPAKMDEPDLEAVSDTKINVKWKKPDDATITGYIIKYGKSDKLDKELKVKDAKTTDADLGNLDEDTKYYVSIAAVNSAGTGEFSDIVSKSTKKSETSDKGTGGGGGGGGGGGNGGGGGSSVPSVPSQGTTAPQNQVTPSNPNEPFVDLGNHQWAKESIYTLKNKGIISGISAVEFAPANNIKRGDFILILTRMLSVNNEFTDNFADVPSDMYYYNAVGSAKAAGIATGDGINFMPENSITRQDLITLAYRAFLNAGYISAASDTSSLDAFGDKSLISGYALDSMAAMVSAGIIKGDNGNVNPLGNATRAEVAVMCARLLQLMN